jgi:hypothetical protein
VGRILLGLLAICAPLAAQTVELRPAPALKMPGTVDSNSPAHWYFDTFYLFNSDGRLFRSQGESPFAYEGIQPVWMSNLARQPIWIEATWVDSDGTLYAWYHHEPGGVCGTQPLTAPKIGALVSLNGGLSFTDLGIVLEAPPNPDCSARNGYFAGGHGDFSVILDRDRTYFYFLYSNYSGGTAEQGVAVARMAFQDRLSPARRVWKFYGGAWQEPGLGGRASAIFPARTGWARADADAFWGPSVHWNTHLEQYVVLLNRSCCSPGWPQEGIYVSFNADVSDPGGWSLPEKILEGGGWYPQVLGIQPGETDKEAGEVARLYIWGSSEWEIVFRKNAGLLPGPLPDSVDPEAGNDAEADGQPGDAAEPEEPDPLRRPRYPRPPRNPGARRSK